MQHKLVNLKVELEALLRLLQDNNKDITYQHLEKLILRHSELLDTALNPRA